MVCFFICMVDCFFYWFSYVFSYLPGSLMNYEPKGMKINTVLLAINVTSSDFDFSENVIRLRRKMNFLLALKVLDRIT